MAVILGGGGGSLVSGYRPELKATTASYTKVWEYPQEVFDSPFLADESQLVKILDVDGVGRLLRVHFPCSTNDPSYVDQAGGTSVDHLLVCYDDYRILIINAGDEVLTSAVVMFRVVANSMRTCRPVVGGAQPDQSINTPKARQFATLSGTMICDPLNGGSDPRDTLFYYNGLYFKRKLTLYAARRKAGTSQVYMTWEEFKR